MTIDGLLTFAGLLLAMLAIITRARRLDLQLRWSHIETLATIPAIIAVFYLQFYQVFKSYGYHLGWLDWNFSAHGITPEKTSFVVVLVLSLFLWFRLRKARLPRRKIVQFRRLGEELMHQGNHAELLLLLEMHLSKTVKVLRGGYWDQRFREKIENMVKPSIEYLLRQKEKKGILPIGAKKLIFAVIKPALPLFLKLIPSYEKQVDAAAEILRNILLKESLTKSIVSLKPYFGLQLLELNVYDKHEFMDAYFREFMTDISSVFYFEIKNNQNIGTISYYILPTNRLLFYLFNDATVAKNLSVWKPVGEFVLTLLDEMEKASVDKYNFRMDDYYEEGKWKCPIFTGIRFFDIMVKAALEQNIRWHMWLYYLDHFTKTICRNFNPDPRLSDESHEFPTKYSYLLYHIISTLVDWIRTVQDLPEDQANAKLESISLYKHENGNIVKCSIFCLGRCIKEIVITPEMPERFRRNRVDSAFRLFFDLRANPKTADYAKVLLEVLMYGGESEPMRSLECETKYGYYLGFMISCLPNMDLVPGNSYEYAKEALTILVPKFLTRYPLEALSEYIYVNKGSSTLTIKGKNTHGYKFDIRQD